MGIENLFTVGLLRCDTLLRRVTLVSLTMATGLVSVAVALGALPLDFTGRVNV